MTIIPYTTLDVLSIIWTQEYDGNADVDDVVWRIPSLI